MLNKSLDGNRVLNFMCLSSLKGFKLKLEINSFILKSILFFQMNEME